VSDAGLLWFEVWVSVDSTTPDGRKVHTEGYRRFGEAPSKTPYGLVSRLPKEYRERAEKVLESMGLPPKRTTEMRSRKIGKIIAPGVAVAGKLSANEEEQRASRATEYADLTITEKIAEINERAGAENTGGGGAGQSTYEPPRTKAATVNDAAHSLRLHGTEIAVGPQATEEGVESLGAWWQEYLRPYGGGASIPAKIVRLPDAEALAAVERLAEHVNEACSTCGTTPVAIDEATLTLGCPQCGELRYVSLPRGILRVGGKRALTSEEEMEAAWASREDR
jgi:ribosomal protein S27E